MPQLATYVVVGCNNHDETGGGISFYHLYLKTASKKWPGSSEASNAQSVQPKKSWNRKREKRKWCDERKRREILLSSSTRVRLSNMTMGNTAAEVVIPHQLQ